VVIYVSLLCLVLGTAGVVTWYYHMHEPVDQQEDGIDDEDDSVTPADFGVRLPGAAGFSVTHHRQAFFTAEGRLKFRHI